MNKILIIDDKIEDNPYSGGIISMSNKWMEKLADYATLIDIASVPDLYFDWDDAGNKCEALFDSNTYSFVFIHHSQQGDSLLPSNIIDLIKGIIGDKLVLFSGSITEFFLNIEIPSLPFRSITRDRLWKNIIEFVKKSLLLNEWTIEILYYNYDNQLVGEIMQMQDSDMDNADIIKSREFLQYIKLKHISVGSAKYKSLISAEDESLIDLLRSL